VPDECGASSANPTPRFELWPGGTHNDSNLSH